MIKHLSYSSIRLWNECPRAWWLRYFHKMYEPYRIEWMFGTVMHECIEKSLLNGLKPKEFLSGVVAKEIRKQRLGYNHPDVQEIMQTATVLLESDAMEMVLADITLLGPSWVEKKVKFYIPGVPVPVIGYIDFVEDDCVPVDIKTSWRDWDDEQAAAEYQPKYYLYALDCLLPERPTKDTFRHLIVVKNTSNPRAYFLESQHPDYAEHVEEEVRRVWNGIQAKEWLNVDVDHSKSCQCYGHRVLDVPLK